MFDNGVHVCFSDVVVERQPATASTMGNVSPNTKGTASTGCNPLMSPEKKHIHQQNDLNAKRRQYQTQTSQYINGNGNVKDVKFSVNDNHSTTDSKHSNGNNNGCGERTTSPVPLGTEKIRLTMDVNNSRPSSQSSTPVLTRKAAIRDGSHTSSTQSSSAVAADQNRSNSSSSLKDSQAKDIMISYSHLDKEIMLKLKGMRHQVLVV